MEQTEPAARGGEFAPARVAVGAAGVSLVADVPAGEYETPPEFFARLDGWWGRFTLDAFASAENALCALYFTRDDNALVQPWTHEKGAKERVRVWANPPYDAATLGPAVEKMYVEGQVVQVVGLFPPNTATAWWHKCVMRASDVLFVAGRLHFGYRGVPYTRNRYDSVVVRWHPYRLGRPHFETIRARL